MLSQRNFLIEHEDSLLIDSATINQVIARLPAKDWLCVSDIAVALEINPSLVYAWIDEGAFPILNGSSKTRPYYKIARSVFLAFLKTRIQ